MKTEAVAAPRTVPVYPETADEARLLVDRLRDEVRQWQLTAKVLYDETVALAGLLAAERRKRGAS